MNDEAFKACSAAISQWGRRRSEFEGTISKSKKNEKLINKTIKFSFIKTLWCTLFPVILQEEGTCFPVVNFIPSTGRVYSVSRKRDLS